MVVNILLARYSGTNEIELRAQLTLSKTFIDQTLKNVVKEENNK